MKHVVNWGMDWSTCVHLRVMLTGECCVDKCSLSRVLCSLECCVDWGASRATLVSGEPGQTSNTTSTTSSYSSTSSSCSSCSSSSSSTSSFCSSQPSLSLPVPPPPPPPPPAPPVSPAPPPFCGGQVAAQLSLVSRSPTNLLLTHFLPTHSQNFLTRVMMLQGDQKQL